MDPIQTIEQIIESRFRIAALATRRPERAREVFERMARFTGRAVYLWERGTGLQRLAGAYEPIPGTGTLRGALDYIASTVHFGVYLIPDVQAELGDPRIEERLWRIARGPERARRLVVLMDEDPALPRRLVPFAVRIVHGGRAQRTG
ncbi:MAG TPA: hypothetical protein ENK20_05475 [Chromatiales bacterium]|nr:hypothetical protein [Chromatiales bacterium]